jgi:hypothetical protein
MDLWHFISDDAAGTWRWRRVRVTGELVDESEYAFHSYNVCVADAIRAGYSAHGVPARRVRSSEAIVTEEHAGLMMQRRRPSR